MASSSILDDLAEIAVSVQEQFKSERRVLSYQQYLELFEADPRRHSRDAAQYLKDAFDHFGTEDVKKPWGKSRRFKLFDLAWLGEGAARADALVGHEQLQSELYRVLRNFSRQGRANRLPLLHGPNGSAKSTIARCLMLALEHYSQTDDGALYRFHWVFPNRRSTKGAIGFGDKSLQARAGDSYAHLDEEFIDARLLDEIRDHPLLLLPRDARRKLLQQLLPRDDQHTRINDWLWEGSLSHKNRVVYDALLASAEGELNEVLRHVQVERYFISRRYRTGAVTLGPELSIDASERQITADRSLGALPSSLQAASLFEAHGELIEASGGIIEFSDLLKRPIDAFKYLQLTVETGEVALPTQNIRTNCVMLSSANEVELTAFRKHPTFESFRSRVVLIRAPYLRSWLDERAIYDAQILPLIQSHVAPHAASVAAMFAVLTRLKRPDPDKYPRQVRDVIRSLSAFEKLMLYANGQAPARLDGEKSKALRAVVPKLYSEADAQVHYEGSVGASPREMRTVLLNAAQNPKFNGLSPFAVLEELDRLCSMEVEYVWLQLEALDGGYHDHAQFRAQVRAWLLTTIEDDFSVCSGLVEDRRYEDLFDRYIHHVTHWVKGEKVKNTITGGSEDPDERLMQEVETLLALPDDSDDLRHSWLNRIAAWAIENPGKPVRNSEIFSDSIGRLRDAVYGERREALAKLCHHAVQVVRESTGNLSDDERKAARRFIDRLCDEKGYSERSMVDAATALIAERFEPQSNSGPSSRS